MTPLERRKSVVHQRVQTDLEAPEMVFKFLEIMSARVNLQKSVVEYLLPPLIVKGIAHRQHGPVESLFLQFLKPPRHPEQHNSRVHPQTSAPRYRDLRLRHLCPQIQRQKMEDPGLPVPSDKRLMALPLHHPKEGRLNLMRGALLRLLKCHVTSCTIAPWPLHSPSK